MSEGMEFGQDGVRQSSSWTVDGVKYPDGQIVWRSTGWADSLLRRSSFMDDWRELVVRAGLVPDQEPIFVRKTVTTYESPVVEISFDD